MACSRCGAGKPGRGGRPAPSIVSQSEGGHRVVPNPDLRSRVNRPSGQNQATDPRTAITGLRYVP